MKRRGLVVAVVLLLVGGSVYVVGDQLRWWRESCDVSQSIFGETGRKPGPIGLSGDISAVDSGSGSRSKNVVPPGGAVAVRNNTDRVAYRTRIAFHVEGYRLTGSQQNVHDENQSADFTVEVSFIMPGQRVGVAGRYPKIEHVTSQDVRPKTTTWVSRDDLGDGFSPPKSSYRGTVHRGSGKPDEIRYAERSKSCRALHSRDTAVVFRDKKGQIVGGDLLKPKGAARPCSPGRHKLRLAVANGTPPNADDSRTEVYSYCDLNSPKRDVNKRPS